MHLAGRFVAIAAMAFATSLSAQPYGLLESTPGYWHPLGRFGTAMDGEHTGGSLAFAHYGYNADPSTFSAISVLQAFDEEQLDRGHGSYWQTWTFVTVKCAAGTFRVTDQHFYNKPRFADASADELWSEKYVPEGASMLDDKAYTKPNPGSLGEAVVKAACSEPVGTNM